MLGKLRLEIVLVNVYAKIWEDDLQIFKGLWLWWVNSFLFFFFYKKSVLIKSWRYGPTYVTLLFSSF